MKPSNRNGDMTDSCGMQLSHLNEQGDKADKINGCHKKKFPRVSAMGDKAVCIEFGQQIDLETNLKIHALYKCLTKNVTRGMREAVPSNC